MGASTEPSEAAPFWSLAPDELFARLNANAAGLSDGDAAARLGAFGRNTIRDEGKASLTHLLLKQFASPLVLILIFGAIVSLALHDTTDSIIILTIVAGSSFLSFWQEARASNAVAALRSRLALTSEVVREGKRRTIPAAEIVPGDILLLSAGNLVPADGLVLEATDFLVTQAALTGESLPVEKRPCVVSADLRLHSVRMPCSRARPFEAARRASSSSPPEAEPSSAKLPSD